MSTENNPCHIIFIRRKHLIFRVLPLRVVLNGTHIYQLGEKEPVAFSTTESPARLTVTNGFHHSVPLSIDTSVKKQYAFQVDSYLDNIRLGYAVFLCLLLFSFFLITGMNAFRWVANLPILYIIFIFYFYRKNMFIIRPVDYEAQSCRG
jgi:hypothetical protein